VRPGEGVFTTGSIPRDVADRLLATLRRYGAVCHRDGARVRAVATSAVREARNGGEIVRRARTEAGLELEMVSGREEARLICLGVLHGRPPHARSLVLDIGGGSTEVGSAVGEEPTNLWSVALGAVRLTGMFGTAAKVRPGRLALLRSYADEAFREGIPGRFAHPRVALGSSGTINAVVSFAASKGRSVSAKELSRAVDELRARLRALAPDADPGELVPWLRRQRRRRLVAIVGHEPHLSSLVEHLLAGRRGAFVELKKGGAWCSRSGRARSRGG